MAGHWEGWTGGGAVHVVDVVVEGVVVVGGVVVVVAREHFAVGGLVAVGDEERWTGLLL